MLDNFFHHIVNLKFIVILWGTLYYQNSIIPSLYSYGDCFHNFGIRSVCVCVLDRVGGGRTKEIIDRKIIPALHTEYDNSYFYKRSRSFPVP